MSACTQCCCEGFHADDCPIAPGALGPGESETLAWMRDSDSIKLRDIAAIGATIAPHLRSEVDAIDVAKEVIAAQRTAGLVTFDDGALRSFIAGIKAGRRGTAAD